MNEKMRIRKLLLASIIPTVGLLIMGLGWYFWFKPVGYNGHFTILLFFFAGTFLLAFLVRLVEIGAIVFRPFDPDFFEREGVYDIRNRLFWHYMKPQLVVLGGVAVAGSMVGGFLLLPYLAFIGLVLVPCSAISAAYGARKLEVDA